MQTSKANLAIHGLDIEVTVKGNRTQFTPAGATPENLGRVQRAVQDWLGHLGHGGTATINAGSVVAEVSGYSITDGDIRQAETYLNRAFATSKGMAG
jgi:hypothetical protein